MKTLVSSTRCSLIARASPARLLKLRGVGTTVVDPARSSARWCLVDVLPKLPVIATTEGLTASRRRLARSTQGEATRSSIGTSTTPTPSTTTKLAATRTAPATKGTGESAAATPRPTSATAEPIASVRSRRVQASGLVRPRTDRPSGPTSTARPVSAARGEKKADPTIPATAASPRPTEPGDDVHHRHANLLTAPGR